MKYNPDLQHRRSIRLRYYDYAHTGGYFITICTFERLPVLGEVDGDHVTLSDIGQMVSEEWLRSGDLRSEIGLDEFVVMPNHLHAIVWIDGSADGHQGVPRRWNSGPRNRSLSSLVVGFKSATTRRANEMRRSIGAPLWQRNYYERVIRDDDELQRIREYVRNNPLKWADDPNYPARIPGRL